MEIVSYARSRPAAAPPRPLPASARAEGAARPDADSDRVAWVDTAKGICIILVVAMHATLGVGAALGGEGFMHAAVAFSKPFRMPDFFLLSGLFLARVIDRDWRSYADKRVVHFAYFYVLWLLIHSAVKYGQVSGGTPAGFVHHLLFSLVEPYSTLWFIHILAVFSVVTKILRPVPPVIVFAAAAALQIMPVDSPSTLAHEFCERWVYFLAGYLFAAHVFRLAAWVRAHAAFALAGIALWAGVNGALAFMPTGLTTAPTAAEYPGLSLVLGLAGAAAIVAVASLLSRARIDAPLRYAGGNSIAIYLAFVLPMAAAREALIRTGLLTDVGWLALVVTAVAVIVPLILERLSRGTRCAFFFRRPAWAHLPAVKPALRLQAAE